MPTLDVVKQSGSMRFPMNFIKNALAWNCMYLLVVEFVYCDSNSYTYERIKKLLLQSNFQTVLKVSALGCCTYCSHTDGCESVSFKPSDGECRLSAISSVAIQQGGTSMDDWNTYTRKTGKNTSNDQSYKTERVFFYIISPV